MTATSNTQYRCTKHGHGTHKVDPWLGSGWASITACLLACIARFKAKIQIVSFTLHFQVMCMAQQSLSLFIALHCVVLGVKPVHG